MFSFTIDNPYEILSVVALIIGVLVVSSSNTVYALMYLIGLFITIAGLLICQGITYVGLLYIVVYVGAIAILFLFVVMIINVRDTELNTTGERYTQSLPLTVVLGSIFLYLVTYFSGNLRIAEVPFALLQTETQLIGKIDVQEPLLRTLSISGPEGFLETDASYQPYSIVESLGIVLYSWGSLWLVIAAIILLLCIVGPIALTLPPVGGQGEKEVVQ